MGLFKKAGLFCLLWLLFFGCRKSTTANWDLDLTVPVVNSLLNIKNFVSDSLFEADNTGLLSVTINREIAAIKLDSLISLPDTTLPIALTNTFFALPFEIGQAITTFPPAELKFNISNGVKMKRVIIRKGFMTVKFSNFLTQPVDLIYKIPSATLNGQPLTVSETVKTGTNSLVRNYDLAGYSLNMRGISGQIYNTIVQTYTFALSTTATSSLLINTNDGARIDVTYSDIVPEYVEGYFGQQTIDIKQDTANLGLSENFRASNFMLSDATMDFTILNEFGAEFTAVLDNNKSINTPDNTTILLNNNQLSNINVNRASKVGSTIYPSVKLLSFTPENSNITSFISNLPNKLAYKGSVSINPLGNVSGYNDFAFYNTGIRLLADINIPLRFTADYFELQSNTKVDFSGVDQLDDVKHGNFVIAATNGFPFAARLQGYMFDKDNRLLDSLFVPGANIIEGGSLNANNEVIAPVKKDVMIPFSRQKIENLRECKTIRIVSRFIMPPNPPEIKIMEKYDIKINIVANLNYNVGF